MSLRSVGGGDGTIVDTGGDITGTDAELTAAAAASGAAGVVGFLAFGVRGWRGFFGTAGVALAMALAA